MSRGPRVPGQPGPEVPVYVISVAAELTGLHPQTLRAYDRLGLVRPGRTGGGGRRYSWRDIAMLREVAELTSSGIGLEGVRRILDLENQAAALRRRVAALEEELVVTRLARDQLARDQLAREQLAWDQGMRNSIKNRDQNLPAVRPATGSTGQAVTVWRRGRI